MGITALLSLITVVMQMFVQLGFDIGGYLNYLYSPLILILNFIPLFLAVTFLYFITGRVWAGYIPVNITFFIALAVDRYKIFFRDEPFKAVDFTVFTEVSDILSTYTFEINKKLMLMLILFVIISVYTVRKVHTPKIKAKVRILGVLTVAVVSVIMYTAVYQNQNIYNSVYIGDNIYHETRIENRKGFLYSFINSINSMHYKKPDGYSTEYAEKLLDNYRSELPDKMPNVIAVMSEAFFDMQNGEKVEFYQNPLEGYNKVKDEAYFGELIVPGFAGSTASTEAEFLTGMNISLIDDSLPMIYKTHINRNVYSLAKFFKDAGYTTEAYHLGHKWFYNRNNVYRRFGFDTFTALDDMEREVDMVNYYASDKETLDLIKSGYDNYLAGENKNGYFSFTVTIQNHGPYSKEEPERERILVRPDGVSDEMYNVLDNYAAGLKDASCLLSGLKDYIETVVEPTVIVFFGDHLPYFDGNMEGYAAIGYDVESNDTDALLRKYTTPYLICSNTAAKTFFEKNGSERLCGYAGMISSNFLSSKLFEYIGVVPSGYFAFVSEVNEKADVINPQIIVKNASVISENDKDISALLNDYKILQYYNMHESDK